MGMILDSIYISVVFSCLVYLFILYQYSKDSWEILDIDDDELPFVSIIVPTLEEENNIETCLRSLKKLNYPKKEIIVVDGGSSDKTVEIAKKFDVNLIVDSDLPENWIGKSYGCHLGFQAARGDILLFTDADTYHTPQSLKITVMHTLSTEAKLFSMLPYQRAEKWYEYLLSFLYFLSFIATGPTDNINNPYIKDSYLGIGQYMMFTREGYNEIGGHMAVINSLVDDLALAKLCKEKELKLSFISSTNLVTTRMYPKSFIDFFHGFRKSISGGILTVVPWRLIFIILWMIYFVLAPYFMVTSFFIYDSWFLWDYTIGIIVNISFYLIYALTIFWYWRKKGDMKWYILLFYPITMVVNFIILAFGLYSGLRGTKVKWKTRYYSTKQSQTQK